MRITYQITVVGVCLLLSGLAQADILGWRIGANSWQQSYEGDASAGPVKLDIEENLGFDDASGLSAYLQFEHFVPLIPNIMVQRTEISTSGRGTLFDTEFGGVTLNGETRSSIDLSHTDITLYYEILDNWVNLDIGVTGRLFDDGIQVTDVNTGLTGDLDIDYVLPLLYAEARFDLPFSGLSLGVSGSGIGYDGDTAYDLKLNLAYEFLFGLGVEGGYRSIGLKYDDGEDYADVDFGGVYIGLFWDL